MTAPVNPFIFLASGGPAPQPPDMDEVRRGLGLLVDPSAYLMVQELPSAVWKHVAGSDLEGQLAAIESLSWGAGTYITLNSVKPGGPDGGRPVTNGDIIRRRHLLIDLDRRKTKETTALNATDEERTAVEAVADQVQEFLRQHHWPDPIVIDSGNGIHLDYPVDFPNEQPYQLGYRVLLNALAKKFNTAEVEVDNSIHDARRIRKVPGTWARKGPHSSHRPHRLCRILSAPEDQGELVTLDLMTRTTNALTVDRPPPASPFIIRAEPDPGAGAYLKRIIEGEIAKLVLTPPGERHATLYRVACNFGNLVAGGAMTYEEAESHLTAASASWKGDEKKDTATIKDGMAKGLKDPRVLPSGTTGPAVKGATTATQATVQPQQDQVYPIYPLPQIMGLEIPKPRWAVDGLLPIGLAMLLGPPKQGKSFFALNLAMTIAGGGKALGGNDVNPGDVLYLALEDQLRRIQDRCRKLLKGMEIEAPGSLYFAVESPKQDQGGMEMLEHWIQGVDNPRLIVIDVWARFKGKPPQGGNAYENDYDLIAPVKQFADRHSIAVLLIHHTKKGAESDWVQSASGTTGTPGAADALMALKRTRGENGATLMVTGRDFEEAEMGVTFDPQKFTWTLDNPGAIKPSRAVTAAEWLVTFMGDRFTVASEECKDAARAVGISFNALREAQAKIGTRPKKIGDFWFVTWPAQARAVYMSQLNRVEPTKVETAETDWPGQPDQDDQMSL